LEHQVLQPSAGERCEPNVDGHAQRCKAGHQLAFHSSSSVVICDDIHGCENTASHWLVAVAAYFPLASLPVAAPKAYKKNAEAMDAFKKTSPSVWRKSARSSHPTIWQFMRQNWLSSRIFKSFDDIVDHCCYAWNTLIDQPWKIMSIARRDWT